MKQQFIIIDAINQRLAIEAVRNISLEPLMVVTIEKETRTTNQNKAQWPILNAFADQLLWPVNGAMTKLMGEEFKDILTAAYRNETVRVAQGFESGMVLLGHRTREFKRAEWSAWIEYLNWAAAEKGVKVPVSKKYEKEHGLST